MGSVTESSLLDSGDRGEQTTRGNKQRSLSQIWIEEVHAHKKTEDGCAGKKSKKPRESHLIWILCTRHMHICCWIGWYVCFFSRVRCMEHRRHWREWMWQCESSVEASSQGCAQTITVIISRRTVMGFKSILMSTDMPRCFELALLGNGCATISNCLSWSRTDALPMYVFLDFFRFAMLNFRWTSGKFPFWQTITFCILIFAFLNERWAFDSAHNVAVKNGLPFTTFACRAFFKLSKHWLGRPFDWHH